MNLSEELKWRGFINQTTYKSPAALDADPITFYWGVDPSADSMTIGNLAAAMMVKCFIKHGHKAVLVVGGATGLVGDPDGKSHERQLKTREEIEHNKLGIVAQYKQIFGDHDFQIVDNYDWFKDMNYLEFLRVIGKHIPLRQMLARDFVESRLGEGGNGISYAEFSYVLVQAYDFLVLFEKYGVTLQVSGADQWGNCIAGVDLIRRKTGGEANVFSAPLVVDSVTGKKFGKSEGGAIWLDKAKTTPTQFYQFWVNVDDNNVENYLKIFTELSPEQIGDAISKNSDDPGQRFAQHLLASEVTKLIHGSELTDRAKAITDVLTGKTTIAEVQDDSLVSELRQEIPHYKAGPTSELAELLVATGLASSKTEARKLIEGNAISLNGQKTDRLNIEASDFNGGYLLVRRGKAFKDTALIELG